MKKKKVLSTSYRLQRALKVQHISIYGVAILEYVDDQYAA